MQILVVFLVTFPTDFMRAEPAHGKRQLLRGHCVSSRLGDDVMIVPETLINDGTNIKTC